MQEIYTILTMKGISLDSEISYEVNNKPYTLTYKFIIDSFLQTSNKEIFIESFNKVSSSNAKNIEKFFEQMGQLLLMGSLSKKI